MNNLKILIAGATVLFASSFLAACTPKGVSESGAERIQAAQEMKKSVNLVLKEVEGDEDINLELVLINPESRNLTSVQAWLSYNPDLLRGVDIKTENSRFELMAPYENDFDHEAGLVTLGRSNPLPVLDTEVLVAEIQFERLADGVAMIEAYDYRTDLSGHTSANMMFEGSPVNILLKPESPLHVVAPK